MNKKCNKILELYKEFLKNKNEFGFDIAKILRDKKFIKELLEKSKKLLELKNSVENLIDEHYSQKLECTDIYKSIGINLPNNIFKKVKIPKLPEGVKEDDCTLLFIDPNQFFKEIWYGINLEKSDLLKISDSFDWFYDTEDRGVSSDNVVKSSYAVWIKNIQQSEKDYCGIDLGLKRNVFNPVEDLLLRIKSNDLRTITLSERIIFDILYFKKNKVHLDDSKDSATLCTGSAFDRNGEKFIPLVAWNENKIELHIIPYDEIPLSMIKTRVVFSDII